MKPATEASALPENAYTPLEPGAVYQPMIPAKTVLPEITWRSVLWGVFFCIIFTVASAYSGLKVGQVMEAAIPISILAIGLARIYRRRSTRAGKRDHHRHRGRFRQRRGGRNFHAACPVHPQAGSAPGADDLHLPGRRLPRGIVPDPASALLRPRDARQASLSRSHGHYRSPGHRRKGRLASAPAAGGYGHLGRL